MSRNSFPKDQLILSILLTLSVVFAGLVSAGELKDVNHKAVTIWSEGVRLSGDLYRPKGIATGEKLPGILLVPGWGGSKENLKKNYATHFAKLGFIVLAFDFKSWGQSDGPLVANEVLPASNEATEMTVVVTHIRKVVNPFSMLADVRAALHYLGGEPQVMPENLGIWGTSFGGGLAMVTAANDDRIKVLVDQMGPVNYAYNLRGLSIGTTRKTEELTARGELPPYPGPTMSKSPGLKGYPNWAALKRYNPIKHAGQITVPTLIIDAENEQLFDRKMNGALLHEALKTQTDSRYVTYPGKHYDMYRGENLKSARKKAADWFLQHLK